MESITLAMDERTHKKENKSARDGHFFNSGVSTGGSDCESDGRSGNVNTLSVPSADYKLLLYDLEDALHALDEKYRGMLQASEPSIPNPTIIPSSSTSSTSSISLDIHYLYSLLPLIDRISKFILLKGSGEAEEIMSNKVAQMTSIFMQITDCISNSIISARHSSIKLLCCRCLLRLSYPYLARAEGIKGKDPMRVDVILFATRTLYSLHTTNDSLSFIRTQTLSSKYVELDADENGGDEYHDCDEIEYYDNAPQSSRSSHITSAGANNESTDETIHTVVDILVDVLKTTWKCMQFQHGISTPAHLQKRGGIREVSGEYYICIWGVQSLYQQ